MRGAAAKNFNTMGFAGTTYAGGPNNLGDFYTITVPDHAINEVGAERFNAPSHAKASYTVGDTGVNAELDKFITFDNVAVTTVTFKNSSADAANFTVRAASTLATSDGEDEDELVGFKTLTSGSNNGLNDTAWSDVTIRLKADGFERSAGNLDKEGNIPAGESVSISVVGVLHSDTMPNSIDSLYEYAELSPRSEERRVA